MAARAKAVGEEIGIAVVEGENLKGQTQEATRLLGTFSGLSVGEAE